MDVPLFLDERRSYGILLVLYGNVRLWIRYHQPATYRYQTPLTKRAAAERYYDTCKLFHGLLAPLWSWLWRQPHKELL